MGEVVRPGHVRLLDYEIELGLVVGAEVTGARAVTRDYLPDLIFDPRKSGGPDASADVERYAQLQDLLCIHCHYASRINGPERKERGQPIRINHARQQESPETRIGPGGLQAA